MKIVVEGCDGTGKTTIAKKLAEDLGFAYIHYPYYQSLTGEKILEMLNHKITWDALSFQSLQICNSIETIGYLNNLEKSHGGVIIDRYNPSTIVYGQLDGLPKELLEKLISVLPKPDLELIVVVDKPYRLSGDYYEEIDKWNKTKGLYLQYGIENNVYQGSQGCARIVLNSTTIETCIEECERIITESPKYPKRSCKYIPWPDFKGEI